MSRVVFVGNIPYDGTEQQLVDVFGQVGKVVSFRLVNDRETGKPKGFGFCEFLDAETARSAIRNLNNVDFHGRSLRVDHADDDKATIGGGSSAHKPAPPPKKRLGVDAVSLVVDDLSTEEQVEVLTQMKAFILSDGEGARRLLSQNQQLAQALLRLLVHFDAVTASDIQSLALPPAPVGGGGGGGGPPPAGAPVPLSDRGMPPPVMRGAPVGPPAARLGAMPPSMAPPPGPPPHMEHRGGRPPSAADMGPPPPRMGMPPPHAGPPPMRRPEMPAHAQETLHKVLAMTPEEIAKLPLATQRQVQEVRERMARGQVRVGPPARGPPPRHQPRRPPRDY